MDKEKILSMLHRLEFCISTRSITEKDTYCCPICGESYMPGIGGEHDETCDLAEIIYELNKEK